MPSKRKRRPLTRRKISTKSQTGDESDGDQYKIDFIEDYRFDKETATIEFLVRWEGYGPDDNTWESFEMFAHDAPETV